MLSQKTGQISKEFQLLRWEAGCHQMRAAVTLRRCTLLTLHIPLEMAGFLYAMHWQTSIYYRRNRQRLW